MGVTVNTSGGIFELPGGIGYTEARATVELDAAGDAAPYDLELVLEYDSALERIVCTSLTAKRPTGGPEVTVTTLQRIAIHNVIARTAMNYMMKLPDEHKTMHSAAAAIDALQPSKGRPRPEVIADAAKAYTLASVAGLPGLQTVSDALRVSKSTATRLVASARGAGLVKRESGA